MLCNAHARSGSEQSRCSRDVERRYGAPTCSARIHESRSVGWHGDHGRAKRSNPTRHVMGRLPPRSQCNKEGRSLHGCCSSLHDGAEGGLGFHCIEVIACHEPSDQLAQAGTVFLRFR